MSVRPINLVLFVAIASNIVFSAPTNSTYKNATETVFHELPQSIDKKYPLTEPILLPDGSVKYRIALISDLDSDSVNKEKPFEWVSYFKQGYLTYSASSKNVSIIWDQSANKQFTSRLSVAGRGLELSELITYNGQLVTIDDKTGLVYKIEGDFLVPWVIVVDGNGHHNEGLKNEWATVKDSMLYVGSHGRETSFSNDTAINRSMMWTKTIDAVGTVRHVDWYDNYVKLQTAAGIRYPGYITHESCAWSDVHGRWFFLPRKASAEQYNSRADERSGTNLLLIATADFNDIEVRKIGEIVPNHGYASFKFIPGTNDTVITAISTLEENGITATYISAFTIDGQIIYAETKVSDLKFEGLEFI